MPIDSTGLPYLYRRFLDNESTPEETQAFWQAIASLREGDPFFETVYQEYVNQGHISKPQGVDWDRMLEKILHGTQTPQAPVVPFFRRYAVLAAVMIGFLLLAGGSYWWHRHTVETTTPVVAKSPNDRQPGINGAVLTLANGQQIVLDTTSNGHIALQGQTQVIKVNGGVNYQASGKGSAEISYNTLATPRARQFRLRLPDGTDVWLNAASSIRFPTAFGGTTRDVEVTGEVYLEVAHDAVHPFRVHTGGETVEVLGTHFNINSYPEESAIRTTLLEGRVRLTGSGLRPVVLRPGEQAHAVRGGWQTTEVNTEDVVAWKNGFFRFGNNSVGVIMRQLSRWYDIDVKYEGGVPDIQIGGEIPRDMPLSKVLTVLRMSGVNVRLEKNQLIIKP